MNSTIHQTVSSRTYLRPLAAMLIMGMAGSVYANTQDATEHCVAGKVASHSLGKAEALRQCAAEGFVTAATAGAGTTARTSANQLHPHLGFGSNAGADAEAIGEESIAIGAGAKAGDSVGQALAIGSYAHAKAWNTTAIGNNSEVGAMGGIAIGGNAKVYGLNDNPYEGGAADGVAIGSDAWVGPNLGDGWKTNGTAGVAIGKSAKVTGNHAVAIGSDSTAHEDYTVAVGSEVQRRRIVNMAHGTDTYDAVTVGQLKGAASALGGGAGLDADGNFVAPTYNVQGGEHRTVGDALGALDDGLKATNARMDDLEAGVGDGLVGQDDATGDLSVGKTTGGSVVDFAGTDGARVLTGVADGRLEAGSRDAVNGGQLAAIRDELAGRVDNLDGRVGQLESGSPGEGGGTPPPAGPGNDAGGRPISNVGDGVADSDAANVGQVNKQVEQALGTARQYTDQRVDALAGALDSFKGEVNDRFARQDQRMNQIGAMSQANSQMAINAAGVGPGKGRIAVGVGMQSNQKAMAIGYAKSINPRVRISVGGSFSGSQNSVGAGMGIDL